MSAAHDRDPATPLFTVRTGKVVVVNNGEVTITPDLTPDYYNLRVLERPMNRSERAAFLRLNEGQMDAIVEAYTEYKVERVKEREQQAKEKRERERRR